MTSSTGGNDRHAKINGARFAPHSAPLASLSSLQRSNRDSREGRLDWYARVLVKLTLHYYLRLSFCRQAARPKVNSWFNRDLFCLYPVVALAMVSCSRLGFSYPPDR
jgi:hypothetical protein